MDYTAKAEWLKKHLAVVISCILIAGLFILANFYLHPLHESKVIIENALYLKWAGFSAFTLIIMIAPKHLKLSFSCMLLCCILNATALAVNDGYMPVASISCIYVEGNHSPFFETARLPFLCDWIFGGASIGDVFYYLFLPVYFLSVWRYKG